MDTASQNPRIYFQVININKPSVSSNFNMAESARCSSIYLFGILISAQVFILSSKIVKISLEINKWNLVWFLNLLLTPIFYGCINNSIQMSTFSFENAYETVGQIKDQLKDQMIFSLHFCTVLFSLQHRKSAAFA